MNKLSCLKKIILLIFAILLPSIAFSNLVKDEARLYRDKGYIAQKNGDINAAIAFYQKAIAMDPSYSIPYNDLGILYEAGGDRRRAEAMYQRAIAIDSDFTDPYYNLASLYEADGDFIKAAFYWETRIRVGDKNDVGTAKAREHLVHIAQVYPEMRQRLKKYKQKERIPHIQKNKERELRELLFEMSTRTRVTEADFKKESRSYFGAGKIAYEEGDYITAIKNFIDALYLDPLNKEAQILLEESQKRKLLE